MINLRLFKNPLFMNFPSKNSKKPKFNINKIGILNGSKSENMFDVSLRPLTVLLFLRLTISSTLIKI
jgi:hypothetical protein